jgi:glutathione S-transferase
LRPTPVAAFEPQLAARLDRGGFICGPAFSAADCMIGHGVMWAKAYGLCTGEVFDRYVGRLAAHESFEGVRRS